MPRLSWTVLPLLAACAAPLPPMPPMPAVEAPAAFANPTVATAPAVGDGRWWQAFGDPALDAWMQATLAASPTLAQAEARLRHAQALARAAGAASRPQLGAGLAASRQGGPLVNAAGEQGSLFSGALNAQLELDPAGRRSRAADAARLDAEAQAAQRDGVRLALQADTVQAWLTLAALADDDARLERQAALLRRKAEVQRARQAQGLVAPALAAQAEADAVAAEAEREALAPRRAEARHRLLQLAGGSGGALPPPRPVGLPGVPAGIPAQVLARRPDVAAAERRVQAALQRLGVAQAAWWPAVTLTASGGVASGELGSLLAGAARSWGLGALLALPLWDGGRREAGIDAARADHDAALAAWREQVLLALREVEDRLAALHSLALQAAARERAEALAAEALALARQRRDNGLAAELDVIDAERHALRAARARAAVDAERRQVTVGLVRALGGGWDAAAPLAQAGGR